MFQLWQSRRTVAVIPTCAILCMIWLAGCTSNEPNPVGSGMPGELQVEGPNTQVIVETVVAGHVEILDEDVPYDQTGVLYFGHQGADSSSILLNYDFSALPDTFPEWFAYTTDNIFEVELRLYRLKYYTVDLPDTTSDKQGDNERRYRIHRLTDPLDASLYPGPEPAFDDLLADQFDSGAEPTIDLSSALVADWIANGMNGIIVREGDDSFEGLVGYGSREMDDSAYGEIEQLDDDSTFGPVIQFRVYDELWSTDDPPVLLETVEEHFVIKPTADVSTLHARPAPSADLSTDIVLQTHQRISPYFAFDTTAFPADVFVNRAVIRLAVDFDHTVGQQQSLVVHEIPRTLVEGVDSITLQALSDESTGVTGQYAVDYETMAANESDWVGWDVTSTIQRMINGVLDTNLIFLMSAGETFTSYQVTAAYSPDFYYSRYVFRGTDEPVLAPHLEITYTPFSGGAR
jgi:hypothetical protein